jgi:hypothetical protein
MARWHYCLTAESGTDRQKGDAMNSKDRMRMNRLRTLTDYLMDSLDTGAGITNADVVESLLNDIALISGDREPEAIPALVELDKAHCNFVAETQSFVQKMGA